MAGTAEKRIVLDELANKISNSKAIYIANYEGMSVDDINELRGAFRKQNIFFKVYKNKLVKLAMEEAGGFDDMLPALVEQNGFAFVDEELPAPAKVLKDFIKENDKPKFKAAFIDGDFYSEDKLDVLASMKSRTEIIGDIMGLLMAPAKNVVSALTSQGSTIASAVKTIADKGDE